MKLVVTGTRGIPDIMGGVETHCEELFPRIAAKGVDTTLIRRKDYVRDSLTEWKGVKLVDISAPKRKSYEAVVHTFRAVNKAKKLGADVVHIHAIGPALLVPYAKMLGEKAGSRRGAYPCHRACAVSAIRQDARHEGGVHASRARL